MIGVSKSKKIWIAYLFILHGLASIAPAYAYEYQSAKNVEYLGIESYRDVKIVNWAENVQFHPEIVFVPKTKEDLIKIIQDAHIHQKRVTLIGKGHSWNPLMEGAEYLISTVQLNQVWVHEEESSVTVEAGATIAHVDQIIEKKGFMVPCNIVGTTDITYGGIMATGSHGSGRDCPTMSDFIQEIEFIKSNGEVEVVSEATHGEEVMNAARLNLGLFGVMYKIKFKVQKAFNVQVTDQGVPLEKLFEVLPDYLKEKEDVEVLWFPMTERAIIKSWVRTDQAENFGTLTSRLELGFTKWALYQGFRPVIKFFMEEVPSSISWFAQGLGKHLFPDRTYIETASKAIHYVNEAENYPINETEIAVAYDFNDLSNVKKGWDSMVHSVYKNYSQGNTSLNIIVHMRFLKSSRALLSPSYKNERTCYMDYGSYYKTPGWTELVNQIWEEWRTIPGVKLHWAKDMRAYKDLDLWEMYGAENVNQFLKIRSEFDPSGMFLNDFMKKIFKLN